MFDYKEFIGIVASVFIVCSLCFPTKTFKGTLLLRGLNSLGCIAFIIYGCLLPAWATAIANSLCLVINIVYMVLEIRAEKKRRAEDVAEGVTESERESGDSAQ